MRLLFGWNISFKRLYFKSSRVEYQIRLWRKVKYKRPEKHEYPIKGITEAELVSGISNIEEGKQ